MTPFSMAPQGAGGPTYGFNTSPAYMGDGSTGGAQPGAPSMGLLASLQPFLQRMQAQQAMGQKMVQPPAAAPVPGGDGSSPAPGTAAPASPNGFRPGILSNLLAGSNGKGMIPNFFNSLIGGQGDVPGQPLNILPPGPTP